MNGTPTDTTESAASDYFKDLLNDAHNKVTVKFVTEDGKVFTQSYVDTISIKEIKNILVDVFAVPASSMDIQLNGKSIADGMKLNDLPVAPFGVIEFTLLSTNLKHVISAENAYKDFAMPDAITVRIETEDNGFQDVIVEIVDKSIKKPFLGGYVSRQDFVEYHHGYSQTGPPKPKVPPELKNHRDTQTYFYRNRRQNTNYAHATQMTTTETWIPNVNDKILTAGPYETAEEWERRRALLQKVMTIQRYFRAWKMKMALHALSAEYKRRIAKEKELELYYESENDKRKRLELIGKVFPKTKRDFAMILSLIERWKTAEIKRISANYCGASKMAELFMLLDKEIEMLRAVEVHRQRLKGDRKVQANINFFRTISAPVEWNSYKNIRVQMDTIASQKGKEVYDLYVDLNNKKNEREDYVQALLNVRLLLHGHNCYISLELINLIDRACELIGRGITNKHLDALQKRIHSLLVRHTQICQCNEGLTSYVNRRKEKLWEHNLYYCYRCEKLKTADEYYIDTRTTKLKMCTSCVWNDKSFDPFVNLEPYRFMLKMIRRDERARRSTCSYIFILQDKDIYYIVAKIWHSHSALSECSDIYDLTLCRFHRHEDWSPWNCILLSRAEAKEHLRIKKLEDVYDEHLLLHVRNKHALARRHFNSIYKLNEEFQEKGEEDTIWNELIEHEDYVPVDSKVDIC